MDFDVVPYEDIIWGERIGGGSFGSVFKGQYLGIDIAIKEIHMSNQYDVQKYFEREWRIMRECRHPNIVLFLGLSKEPDGDGRVFIVSEFIPRGNLRSFIRSRAPFPWSLRISYATDVARAVAYLHARQCLHRDLKGENLLITSNDRLKVADFGFARITGRNAEEMKHMTYCGTDGYMSPEIIMGEQFDLPTDVYSLGIIFIEILTGILVGSKVYSRKAPKFTPDADIVRRRASAECPPDFIDLALECCRFAPAERPKMPAVLERLQKIEREIERGIADDAPHTGSLRVKHKRSQKGANALKALFDVADMASEMAAAEVEAQLGTLEDDDNDNFASSMEVDSPANEVKDRIAIARAEVPVNGAGPAKSIPWDEMPSEFTDHVGDITPESGAEPLLGDESMDASALSWRTASPEHVSGSTVFPAVAGSPPATDPSCISPARPMPCEYPPSPPYEEDDPVGSTCTIRGSHTSGAMTPEEPPTPTVVTRGAILVWDEGGRSSSPEMDDGPASPIGLPTPQPSEPAVSPRPSIGEEASRRRSMQGSRLTHRFSIARRQPEAPTGRRPALLSVVAANFAFAFLPRPAAKDRCPVCSKSLGSRVVMQCDDCGLLVHTKCSASAPRNCHSEEKAACTLGVDP